MIGKAGEDVERNLAQAESCLKRALDLNPELSIAHNLYAQLETDLGRSKDALVRLTARAISNSSDPEVFAGLVQACRYCGLLEASVAVHDRARQLDTQINTSVRHTHWLLGDGARALEGGGRFFLCSRVLARDPWLDTLRSRVEFDVISERAVGLEQQAAAAFAQSGGDRLLGVDSTQPRNQSSQRHRA